MVSMNTAAQSFFIWTSVLITLVISCASLIALWFGLIDASFLGYTDSGGMQTGAAALIVSFPILLYVMRLVYIKELEAEKAFRPRQWVLYAVLFFSGFTLAYDVYTLLSSFLYGEELTAPFLMKVFLAGLLFSACFMFYRLELKNYWSQHKKHLELVAMGSGLVVVFSVALLFIVVGTPSYMRKMRSDQVLIQQLQTTQYQIIDYFQRKGSLPKN
ncbi:MAG: hypothetical protein RI911_858, partial [Candidatus Parcubacteria bacterium]